MLRICLAASAPVMPREFLTLLYLRMALFTMALAARHSSMPMITNKYVGSQ